jgi:hypothetical protein
MTNINKAVEPRIYKSTETYFKEAGKIVDDYLEENPLLRDLIE